VVVETPAWAIPLIVSITVISFVFVGFVFGHTIYLKRKESQKKQWKGTVL
jgi:hypothetical protein